MERERGRKKKKWEDAPSRPRIGIETRYSTLDTPCLFFIFYFLLAGSLIMQVFLQAVMGFDQAPNSRMR